MAGLGRMAECATVEVFENRKLRRGRKVPLRVVVLRARGNSPKPDPLFLLAGGPGQAASEAFGPILTRFGGIANERDIVMVDQRGTGRSGPLDCEEEEGLAAQLREGSLERMAKLCVTTLSKERDLTKYVTPVAADDLDEVRAALGYQRINLLGVSYGTRLALVYARRHPDSVRSIVIDGVAPTDMAIPASFAVDGQRALDGVLRACHEEEPCRRAFGDLRSHLKAYLSVLASEHAQMQVRHPRSGKPLSLSVSRAVITQLLRGFLYAPELVALFPLTVQRMTEGRYQSFIAQTVTLGEAAQEEMSHGLFLSVVCAEDLPRIDEALLSGSDGTMIGRAIVQELRDACAFWPRAELDPGYARPTKSKAPTLILSGELDPVTPPRWGEHVLAHLPNGRHVVVPEAGHGVSMRGCLPSVIRDFIDAASVKELKTDCVKDYHRPDFFIDYAGPAH